MKFAKFCAVIAVVSILASCGAGPEKYRVGDDLLISFSEALSERTLKEENIVKSEDGRRILSASYTYASDKPQEDMENYLYYLLNNYEASFIGETKMAYNSKDEGYMVVVTGSYDEKTFTLNIEKCPV